MTAQAALPLIEEAVRELVRVRGIDPATDGTEVVEGLVKEVLDGYSADQSLTRLPALVDPDRLAKTVMDNVVGLGPLQPLMDDPSVEEIWINGPGRVFCARDGEHRLTPVMLDQAQIADLVERMLRASGRRLDLSHPFVDATLQDGSRLHVAIPDITRDHWAVNIRKFVLNAHTLDELVRRDSLSVSAARFLSGAVTAGLNIVVGGGTQAGKTTLLNCLASVIPARERVITCEEVFELQVPLPDVVGLQTRRANLEGEGAIGLRRLIVEALRMRPDRIIVGEVRQHEAFDLLIALNSGLPGMTSIHANSAQEALGKLTTLPLLAGENVTHSFILPTVASSIDLLVHLQKERTRRRVTQVVGVTGRVEGDRIETSVIFEPAGTRELRWTGLMPPKEDRFEAVGLDLRELLA